MNNAENMKAYIRYRIEKSQETYKAACLLADGKMWNSVINRLYYACFYAVSALLLNKEITARTHAGIISQFSENFVRTGLVALDDFKIYSKLMNWRSKGDYGDMYDFEEEDVLPLIKKAENFIENIISLIDIEDNTSQ